MVIQQQIGLDPSTRSAIIVGTSGLGIAPYTSYTCKVTASTEAREGESAMVTAFSAEDGEYSQPICLHLVAI